MAPYINTNHRRPYIIYSFFSIQTPNDNLIAIWSLSVQSLVRHNRTEMHKAATSHTTGRGWRYEELICNNPQNNKIEYFTWVGKINNPLKQSNSTNHHDIRRKSARHRTDKGGGSALIQRIQQIRKNNKFLATDSN